MRNEPARSQTKEPAAVRTRAVIGLEMKVGISSFGSWMLGVSANLGSFAFLIHASMIGEAGPFASLVAWIVAAAMMAPLALVLAELASMFPDAGGPYVYKYVGLKRLIPGMGEMLGFLTGWAFWIYLIVSYACMSNGLVNLLSVAFWGGAQRSPLWFGPVVIAALFGSTTVLNLLEVKSASRLNVALTLAKLAVAVAFVGLAVSSGSPRIANLVKTGGVSASRGFWADVFAVLPLAVAGYCGIEMAGCSSSETVEPSKSVPRAILKTALTLVVVYVGMCAAIGMVARYRAAEEGGVAVIEGTSSVATAPSVAAFLGGPAWGFALTAGVALSITSCAFSGLLATARTSLSMAETGLFPRQFARLARSKVPAYALWFQLVFLCTVGIGANLSARSGLFPDAYAFLGGALGFLYAFLALVYGVCLIGLRHTDPDLARPFRLGATGNRAAWVVGALVVVLYAFVAFVCVEWTLQAAGWLFLAMGLPIYLYYRWRPRPG